MANIIVIVADNTCARVFRATSSKGSLEEEVVLTHPENRLQDKEMTSDRAGFSFSSSGYGRRSLSKSEDPKEHEIKLFVSEIDEYLRSLKKKNDLHQLILIAAPKLLGRLKKQLSSSIQEHITYELNKNIAKKNAEEIRKHLPKYLANPQL